MNRIDELFLHRQKEVLSIYFTAGYPALGDTGLILKALESAGADLVEIGFPFSDPVADGPVIQGSSHQALENGMNLDILFAQLRELKGKITIPVIMMGYFNTVYRYSVERFLEQCIECGIAGVIIPDLPPELYERDYREQFEAAGIHFICLIAPQTTPGRAKYLESLTRGFIYRLSSSSTTGSQVEQIAPALSDTKAPSAEKNEGDALPSLIGFGIHDHQTFKAACERANGAIIGTAFIKYLKENFQNESNALSGPSREQHLNLLCKSFIDRIRM
jgi:tryptophan synthase alpha chain